MAHLPENFTPNPLCSAVLMDTSIRQLFRKVLTIIGIIHGTMKGNEETKDWPAARSLYALRLVWSSGNHWGCAGAHENLPKAANTEGQGGIVPIAGIPLCE
jgi:hypothetical protein